LNCFSLLRQPQYAINSARRRRFHESIDTAATTRNAPAPSMEYNVALISRCERLRKRALRLMGSEPGCT